MKTKKIKIFFLLLIVLAFAILFWQDKQYKPNEENSVFCQKDKDCLLYDCTNCGTKDWVLKNNKNTKCDKKIPGLSGCVCQNNICKRNYQKK